MPNYANVPILTDLGKLAATKAKKEGTASPLAEETARQVVEAIMKKYAKVGTANTKTNYDYTKAQHKQAKGLLTSMNNSLKKMQAVTYVPDPYTIKEIEGGLDIMKVHAKSVADDSAKMYKPMKEYRESWETTVKKICEDSSFIAPYIAMRTKTMTVGKQTVAMKERIDEYVKRATLVVKAAQKAYKKAANAGEAEAVDQQKAVAEAKALVKTFEKNVDGADKAFKEIGKKNKSMGVFLKKKPDVKDKAVAESFLQDIETNHKKLRGYKKTSGAIKKEMIALAASHPAALKRIKRGFDLGMMKLLSQIDQGADLRDEAIKTNKKIQKA